MEQHNLPSGKEYTDIIQDALGIEGFNTWAIGNAFEYLICYEHTGNPTQNLKQAQDYIQMVLDNHTPIKVEEGIQK